MKIELKEITVKKLTEGFADNAEQGVIASLNRSGRTPTWRQKLSTFIPF